MRPGLPGIDIDTTIFRPATFIELSIDNLTEALIIGCAAGGPPSRRLPLRVAGGAHQPDRHSAVAGRRGRSFCTCMGATINTMVLAGFIVALGDVVDDAIIDVENIVRRLREYRRAGGTKSTARVILDASLEVRGADRLRDADHRAGGVAGVLHGRALRRVLRAAGARLSARDARVDAGGPDGHAGAVPILLRIARSSTASRRWCRWLQARLCGGCSPA